MRHQINFPRKKVSLPTPNRNIVKEWRDHKKKKREDL